ncbi:hypothetical protein [Paludifilum halophilum]|uniref:Uncharacterized protein n=1 Tax=Paludifilum halophilum TaxID=1642702 RepID=A0A235BAM5_9BACL|nr:hypothetical protein [Paludifilum halophilum]OYD08927.1 hypothetical protein CHM34_03875 [Paludifilum halophilum]
MGKCRFKRRKRHGRFSAGECDAKAKSSPISQSGSLIAVNSGDNLVIDILGSVEFEQTASESGKGDLKQSM